jgi:NADPH-dependent 2,4-dienoyl-CoA reductase/sulfur reductase-like enzyme
MSRNRERTVIVGAGLAGFRAAERLRELSYEGEVVIVGEERHRPYHRPALSKQLLTGKLKATDLGFNTYTELDAHWRLGVTAQGWDPGERVVHLPGDEKLGYDGLIIASGVQPRHLPGVPRHDPRVHVLRTMEDAQALRETLAASKGRVAVIGTGFTGCEVASSARELNREVTVIGRSATLLGALGPELGGIMNDLHADHGVDLALGTEPLHWHCTPEHVVIVLSTGQVVNASCVVLAVGSVLNTGWLRGSGVDVDGGVLCEPTCHVAGVPDAVAAGDIARWPNLRFDGVPRRCEHWLNAVEMGRAAAESLLAGRDAATPFTPLPRFWSEQHGVRLQGAGLPGTADHSFGSKHGSRTKRKAVVAYFREGHQVGIVCLDQPRAMLELTRELDRESAVSGVTRMAAVEAAAVEAAL